MNEGLIQVEEGSEAPKGEGIHESWTAADEAWANEVVAVELRAHARKHGKLIFNLVMQAGMASAALGQAFACVRLLGSKYQHQLVTSCKMQERILNDFLSKIMADNKIEQVKFNECREDIERMGALMAARPGGATGSSGLILPH